MDLKNLGEIVIPVFIGLYVLISILNFLGTRMKSPALMFVAFLFAALGFILPDWIESQGEFVCIRPGITIQDKQLCAEGEMRYVYSSTQARIIAWVLAAVAFVLSIDWSEPQPQHGTKDNPIFYHEDNSYRWLNLPKSTPSSIPESVDKDVTAKPEGETGSEKDPEQT